MKSWKAILVSLLLAFGLTAYSLWPTLLSRSELLFSIRARWPELLLGWLVTYGFAIVILCAAHLLRTSRGESRWVLAYMLDLAAAQYWSAVVILLALELTHTPIALSLTLPPILMTHPALAGVGILLLAGVIGFVVIEGGLLVLGRRGTFPEASRHDMPRSSGAQKTSATLAPSPSAEDWKIFMRDALEPLVQETRQLREAVRAAIEEFRASTRSQPSGQLELTEVAVFRDAAVAIEQSVPKLAQIADALSAAAGQTGHHLVSTASAGAVAEELDELLRGITAQTEVHPISSE